MISFEKSTQNQDKIKITTRSGKIRKLLHIFGDSLKIYPFLWACRHSNGPVGFLLELIGIHDQTSINFIRANESRSNFWTRIQNHVNETTPKFMNNNLNPQYFQIEDAWESKEKFSLNRKENKSIESLLQEEEKAINNLLQDDQFLDTDYSSSSEISMLAIVSNLLMLR